MRTSGLLLSMLLSGCLLGGSNSSDADPSDNTDDTEVDGGTDTDTDTDTVVDDTQSGDSDDTDIQCVNGPVLVVGGAFPDTGDFGEAPTHTFGEAAQLDCVLGDISFFFLTRQTVDLPALRQLTGTLTVTESDLLTSISAPNLNGRIGALNLYELPKLTQVSFPGVTAATTVQFYKIPKLESMNGLASLSEIDTLLNLDGANSLGDISALSNLTGGFWLHLSDSPLTSLAGLQGVTSLNGLTLQYNPQLSDFTALSNLTEVVADGSQTGDLNLYGNDASADFQGFENLTIVDGNLTIAYDAGSTSLLGLQNVSRVGALQIWGNAALSDVALPGLTKVNGDFTISDNATLPTCACEALQTQVESADQIGGTTTISNNTGAANCTE